MFGIFMLIQYGHTSSMKNSTLMIGSLLAFYSLFSYAMAANKERTFIMVKPDGVQRGLVGKIIERFEQKGFKLVAMKFMWVSKAGRLIELRNQ